MTDLDNDHYEILSSDYGQRLYQDFPDDEELASKLNDLNDTDAFTKEVVARARERFYMRPQRGEREEIKEASPTKHVIRNKAKQVNIYEAIAEIIDNIFDNYERIGESSDQERSDALNIEIKAYPPVEGAHGELVITENSGGISEERILPLVQLGLSKRATEGIGAWGEGFKIAAFSLGTEVEVFSTYPEEDPISVYFPHGWLEPDNSYWTSWNVETFTVDEHAPDPGSTFIRINRLRPDVLKSLGLSEDNEITPLEVCQRLADYYGEIYAEKNRKLKDEGYSISINISVGTSACHVNFKPPVRQRLKSNFAFIPWLRPIHWTQTWQAEVEDPTKSQGTRTASLQAEIYAGLFEDLNYSDYYSTNNPGVEMWGNGRLFSLRGRIGDGSVGWGYKFGGRGGTNPKANASSRRIGVIILFTSSDSRDIPWAAPVKHDYNRRSEFYAEIQEVCALAIRLYKNATSLIESVLEPFAKGWDGLSDEEKIDILFQDADIDGTFRSNFKQSHFGYKILNYKPDISFTEIKGSDTKVTPSQTHGVSTSLIKDVVNAAAKTKDSPESVVEYLKAIFPELARKAEIEKKLNLEPGEEISYE